MKVLKIEIKGANGTEAVKLLNALEDERTSFHSSDAIDISYAWKEDDPEPISVTESTPFSRYLQSTTPEGRT